jgi:hypothetical protein
MAENRGTIYERQLCDKMKAAEVVSESFQPAASDSTAPDIVFQTSKNANEKLEVKLDLKTDFGQGSFNFVNGQWVLGGARTTAADEMRRILTNADATGIATREWGTETPWRDMPGVGGKNGTLTVEQAREDYDNHPDKFISVPTSVVFDYYADKDTHYLQIGGSGLYYMKENPSEMNVPQFNGTLKLRIRTKKAGSETNSHGTQYNYRFTTALQVDTAPTPSPVNLDNISEW